MFQKTKYLYISFIIFIIPYAQMMTTETLLFYIGLSSAVHRLTIGLRSGDILGVGWPLADDWTTGHRQKYIYVWMHII